MYQIKNCYKAASRLWQVHLCLEIHSDWEELSKHKVVSIEEIKSDTEVHKELDLYCDTCGELIRLYRTVKKDKDHQ